MKMLYSHTAVLLVLAVSLQVNQALGRRLTVDERQLLLSILEKDFNEADLEYDLEERGKAKCTGDICVLKQSDVRDACLNAHNYVRKHHNAVPLKWSKTPKDEESTVDWATMLAKKGEFKHDPNTSWGENIAVAGFLGDAPENPCVNVLIMWYNEVKFYKKPGFSSKTGHFTQVVWKATTDLNCAVVYNKGSHMSYTVCRYYVPGNTIGQFEENVDRADLSLYQDIENGVVDL